MDKHIKILVVDDFSTMRRIIHNLLGELGFDGASIRDAEGGEQALSALRAHDTDLVITDWNMPGMSGIDLLRAIRADAALQSLPVLMVTAESSRGQIMDAAHAGVNGYIVKPFTAATLKEKIERVFARLVAAG